MEYTTTRPNNFKKWMKRVGFWGFMFFLVKGLVWLALFYFGYSVAT